jgi:hypothetical protein
VPFLLAEQKIISLQPVSVLSQPPKALAWVRIGEEQAALF